MLLNLRDFIQRERVVSLQQMARAFHVDEDALRPMLDRWVSKGVISASDEKLGCQTVCMGCRIKAVVYYSWITTKGVCHDKKNRDVSLHHGLS
jgi:hypothetical protein